MSHYAIAVFSNDPDDYSFDKLLEKYDEADERFFTKHIVSKEDVLKKYTEFVILNPKWSFDDYLENHCYKKDDDGNYYYMYNDDARYDYYTLDARDYIYNLKDNVQLEHRNRKNDYNYEYCNGAIYPYAYVTPDGEWHAPGRVGWFASSTETEEEWQAYLKELKEYLNNDDNPYVSFVDCHI